MELSSTAKAEGAEMSEQVDANVVIKAVSEQRNAALDQVAMLTAIVAARDAKILELSTPKEDEPK